MRTGLWLSAPADALLRAEAARLLDMQNIPLAGFTEEPTPRFDAVHGRTAYLMRISEAVFRGEAIPAALTLRHLMEDALPGNVLRRCLEWQTNLLPCLQAVAEPEDLPGCFRLGASLLACPLSEEGVADAQLPPGQWTEITTGEIIAGHLLRMRSPTAMPILAAENALIPTGDPAHPTLHWYQPAEPLRLPARAAGQRVILHRDGQEAFLSC
ncbi:MAG: hypothetical protein ACI4OY_05770 [Aristaeellaceae bacterium]